MPTLPANNLLDSWNQSLFLTLNAGPDTPHWQIAGAHLVASAPLFLLPLALLALWCLGKANQRSPLLRAVVVMACGLAIAQLIGLLWPQPRPFAVGLGHAWIEHAANASFPSDHMTLFACAALSLLFDASYLLGASLLVLGIAVGLARVYLGIHYPLDLLGGLAVAAVSNSLVWVFWQRYGQSCTGAAENLYRRSLAPAIQRGWIHG